MKQFTVTCFWCWWIGFSLYLEFLGLRYRGREPPRGRLRFPEKMPVRCRVQKYLQAVPVSLTTALFWAVFGRLT